jgi:ArsR family transcriptional regulator
MHPDLDVLADSTRRTLLALLTVEGELCVCELEAALAEPQPVVSRQLAILRTAQWLASRREGRRVYYRISRIPDWALHVLQALRDGGVPDGELQTARQRLADFGGRARRLTRVAS